VLLLGLTISAWGANYLFVRIGLESAAPIWLAALRAGTGLVALAVYFTLVPPGARLGRSERVTALLLGIPNTALFLGLWFTAAGSVPAGEAAVVIYTYPLWVAVLSIPVLRARLNPMHWGSIAAGFAGILLVSEPWAASGGKTPLLPVVELLAAAVSWATATVVVQRRFRPEEMAAVNGYQLLGGAAVLVVVALALDPRHLPVSTPSLWISVVWLGVFGTAFAYAVWFQLLGKVPAATLSAYAFLVPLVALGASAAFLGERLDLAQGAGVALVVGSIYGVSRAGIRRTRTRPTANDPG
jgi:drug/metabolite transporter (DMT)-like permease